MQARHLTASIVFTAVLVLAAPAGAWQFEEFMNPQGDTGVGIVQTASNEPGLDLAFGCDGDRWRQVALVPNPPNPFKLSTDGVVRIGFTKDRFTPDGKWKVREPGRDSRLYFAPAPSEFMGRLYREEQKNPNAVLYMKVRPSKKPPTVVEFPLAGLKQALQKHLWTACKLDIYFGDPEDN